MLSGMVPTGGLPQHLNSTTSTATFAISAAPTGAGPVTASIEITTDIPSSVPDTIELMALGLPAGVTPTPPMVDLGAEQVGSTSPGQMVTLTNCDAGPLTLTNAQIIGQDAADFAIVLQPPSSTVDPSSAVQYLVVLEPQANGDRSATLEIDYDGGTAQVPLVGIGIDGPGETLDSATYYTCSTGGGGAGWPVAVALGLLARRRRRRP